jgi:membrane associated rhomboid family serine protease
LIYIAVIAFLPLGGFVGRIDNFAHIGGFACGFALGKLMVDRPPADMSERKRANAMGWAAAVVVLACFAMAARGVFLGG